MVEEQQDDTRTGTGGCPYSVRITNEATWKRVDELGIREKEMQQMKQKVEATEDGQQRIRKDVTSMLNMMRELAKGTGREQHGGENTIDTTEEDDAGQKRKETRENNTSKLPEKTLETRANT